MIFTEGQGKINFENGTLDLETMTLFPFKREDYLTYCLPYCYTPGTHPVINKFLKETIPMSMPVRRIWHILAWH
jgi:phage/plasmid-associated DNA primase